VRGLMTWRLRGPDGRFPFFIYGGFIALLAAVGTLALVARSRATAAHTGFLR